MNTLDRITFALFITMIVFQDNEFALIGLLMGVYVILGTQITAELFDKSENIESVDHTHRRRLDK